MLTSCILQLSHNCKVMPLLLNILFRWLQISFQGSSIFFFSWLQSPSAVVLEPEKIQSVTVSISPPCFRYLTWNDWTSYHDLHFFNVEVWARFFTLLFLFISRLFSYSSLFVIYVVSRAYLRLLIFLQAILILVWASSSLALHTMCSEYKLNKPHNNIQPWCTPFQFETSAFFHVQS